jgi:site-specific recombinase XerD
MAIAQMVPIGEAETDGQVVRMWLYQKGWRSQNTVRVYEHKFNRFKEICDRPLVALRVSDLQQYQQHLEDIGLAAALPAKQTYYIWKRCS